MLAALSALTALPAVAFGLPASHAAQHEHAYPLAGAIHGQIEIRHLMVAPEQRPEVVHTVKPGQTLSGIALHYYGKASDWPSIWWANRHHIDNPSMIMVGQKLKIPATGSATHRVYKLALSAIPAPPPPPPAAAPAAQPASPPAEAAPPPPASYSGAPGSFQACVIRAESGGNPSAVNPTSGAGGLYQFLPSTWAALGHSGLPENASVQEQNQAFQQEYAQSGTSAWASYDGC